MIGNRLPRLLLLAVALGVTAAVIMLAAFYGQQRWLVNQLVTTSTTQFDLLSQHRFEQRARAQMVNAARRIAVAATSNDRTALRSALDRTLLDDDNLFGIQYTDNAQRSYAVGDFPGGVEASITAWLADSLVVAAPVLIDGVEIGILSAAFDLRRLRSESAAFTAQLATAELERRRVGYLWAGAGTLAALLLCGGSVWLLVNNQSKRIRQLTVQAKKLRDADAGEVLPVSSNDELADLAAVFNDLRHRLRSTTHSRNFGDSILAGMNEAIIVTSAGDRIIRINAATTRLLGYEESELLDSSIDMVIDRKKSRSLASEPPSGLPKETMFQSKSGESIPISYTCSMVNDGDGSSSTRIYAAQNISERRRAEKRMRYLARIDPLTKIPNRKQFQHLLQRAIARARRAGKSLCLFYIDLDHFKEINNTFGHLAGDTTLETAVERLSSALPRHCTIGRFAGDEFAVIVSDLTPNDAGIVATSELAQKLLNRLAEPIFVQGQEVFMTASMGIAYYPKDAANVIDLIRNAGAALYQSKSAGGNLFSLYAPEMNEASVERLITKSKLKRAFERDELLVHYQPIYNLETGKIFGAEALVRWEQPGRGLILPADFIPIAEESGLIIDIGEWVLDKVCDDFRLWQRTVSSPGRVSVNLSLKQLRQLNFISRIRSILRSHEISPTSLELEITETTLMEDPEQTIKLLDQLYGLGLHLAIDDFGTGYSSLSALQQFPINTLKIDQSFVRNVVTNPDAATIVDTIVQMGRNMHMDVVAEGVEEEAQLSFLRSIGCTYAQGLLFGKPMTSDSYLALLLAQADGTDSCKALFA